MFLSKERYEELEKKLEELKEEKEEIFARIRNGEEVTREEILKAGITPHEIGEFYRKVLIGYYTGDKRVISGKYVLR